MWNIARHLLLLVCLLFAVSCHETKPGHYLVLIKDNHHTTLHDHMAWANMINQDSGSGHFGVQEYYDCAIGKGYFAHISGKTATEIGKRDEVLHIVPQSTWSLATAPSNEEIIVDKKIDPKNWALHAISSNPPENKGPYKYHKSQATGTYIYIVDSGIQSDDEEFQGRVISGWGYSARDDLYEGVVGGELRHGTFVAGIAGGVRHGVAKNATLVDVQVGRDHPGSSQLWGGSIAKGLCWTADDIMLHNRANKSVVNISLAPGRLHCRAALKWLERLEERGVTVVVAAGNDGVDVKSSCFGSNLHAIQVGAYDRDFNAANFSNHGTGITVWAPGVEVRSVLSKAVLDREGRKPWPDDTKKGTSYAAPHVAGIIAGWMGETEEGLSPKQVREKLDELSHKDVLGTDDFEKCQVPKDEWEHRLANNRIVYNGADV
ncbi:unnamed protein product [Clonostachys solani]|uniref:Uncharacterized protein n=1 Tax=Clonostachys solani TaxID=160281 RepID=A0A9N9ZHA0_9HYPO|nr:unnamed protein product [Clonostachys solani]